MPDNDIIKALEKWLAEMHKAYQTYLEYGGRRDTDNEQYIDLMSNTLDIITRQKAKIEALEMDNAQLQSDNINANMNREHLQAEIERLKGWDRWIVSESHAPIIKKARAEAIKEFAERLKEKAITYYTIIGHWVSVKDIDNLVKEMEGEHEVS